MAKKYPNIQTLEVYQQGGDTQQVTPCPDATIDKDLNLDNRERSISRFNYGKANSEDKCGNCIFFDISNRMKKCMDNKSGNVGYCSDQEFVCSKNNVCDSYESGGPLTRDEDSYVEQGEFNSEYEESKQTVEQIQGGLQMPGLNQPASPPQEQIAMQQQMPQQPVQPQQPVMPEQQMPSFEYGGSLRKFQYDNDDVDGMENAETNYPGSENNNRSAEDIVNDVETEVAKQEDCNSRGGNWNTITQTCDGLDDNTDIYDAENDKENTLVSKFKDWQTNRGKKRRNRSNQNVDDNFIMYNADPKSGVLGQIGNWFKSVNKDFQNFDVDPNKITKKEFRNYKKYLREENPDLSRKEINTMAKTAFPSAGNNRWGKENYQQVKVTNPFDETRWFDPSDPDKLLTYEQQRQNQYNQYVNKRTAMYPELYQVSSMDLDGNINYTGDKLLGDMIETEYVPDATMLVHNDDNTAITGSYVYDGVDASGQKKYKYIPFDAENPTNITYTPSSQKRENECFELKEKCLGTNPPGEWDGANCKCIEPTSQDKNNQNIDDDANLDDMDFPDNLKFGGAIPTYAYMRDGGQLPKHQLNQITKVGKDGMKYVDDGITSIRNFLNNVKSGTLGTTQYFPKAEGISQYLYDQGNTQSNIIKDAKDEVEKFGQLNPGAYEWDKTLASAIFNRAINAHKYNFDLQPGRIPNTTSIFEDYSEFSPLNIKSILSKQSDMLSDNTPYLGVSSPFSIFSTSDKFKNIASTLGDVRQNLISRMKTTEGRNRIKKNYLGKNASEADVDKFITSFTQIPTLETRASISGNIIDNAHGEWFFNKGYKSGDQRDLTTGRLPYIGMNLNLPLHYGSRIYRHENEHALSELGSFIRDGNVNYKKFTDNPLTEYATSKFTLTDRLPTFGLNKFTGQYLDFINPKNYGAVNAETAILQNLLKTKGYQPVSGGKHLGEAESSINYMTNPHGVKLVKQDNPNPTMEADKYDKVVDLEVKGTLFSEPTAHVAELQQFMIEKNLIPKDDYTKVTADMIANVRSNFGSGKNAVYGYDNYPMRILQTTKDTPGNNKIIANILNKMLTGTALTTAVSELEMKRDGGSLTKFQSKNEWTDEQLLKWLELQNQIVDSPKTSTYDPADVDVTDKSTYPNTKFTYADGTYNEMYPWLPDMSTAEGRSSAYNIHKAATDKFPNYSLMPTVYWGDSGGGDGLRGNAYPYLNETVEDKQIRTGNFSDLNQVMAYATENNLNLNDVQNLTINGKPLNSIYDFGKDSEVSNAENLNIDGTFYDANMSQLFDNVIQDKYNEYKKDYTPVNIPGSNVPNLAAGESWTSDGNIRKINASDNVGGTIIKPSTTLNQKGEVLTKDRNDMISFEEFEQNILDNYDPNYQAVTSDNYYDAVKNSLNPYFEGSMGGYGGGALGYNSGNSQLTVDGQQVNNPMFIDHGRGTEEMNTLWGYVPTLIGGAGVARGGLNLLSRGMARTIPGSSAIGAPVTFGQANNAYWAQEAVRNTLPEAYTDFSQGRYDEGFGNLALGALELSGLGNTGLINVLPKNVSQLRNLNKTFPALNQKGTNLINTRLNQGDNFKTPLFNVNPFSKQTTQLDMLKKYTNRDFSNLNLNPNYQPSLLKKYGGSLYKAQNGGQDVAEQYMVNPEQFDYEAGMPKEGAISSYGDVWQGGQWVDATEENQGFTTPDSDQFNVVADAFSTDGNTMNRNVNDMFTSTAVNQGMKKSAANTYDVRRRDIDLNTLKPKEGSINRSYGDVFNAEEDMFVDQSNVTPEFDVTDDFAFEGDDNTLSRRQLRGVRKNKRREDKAIEAGFESYEDMQTAKQEEKDLRKQRRKDRRDRWGDTFGQRMRNRLNYVRDSKLVQGFEKGAKALVEGAKIGSNIIDASNINDGQNYINSTRSADDAYALMSADTLSRGEEDENTGLMFGDDKVIARQGKYGTELPRAQYGHTGWGMTNPRMGLKYNSGENPLSIFVGADMMNCWGGSCRDAGGGKFKRGFYSELSPYKTTKTPQTITPDGEIIDGESYEKMTASGDLGARLRFDQDFYSLPTLGPSGIMLEGSGGAKFGEDGFNPYYGGRAGMQFKAPMGLKLPKFNYRSKDRADFMPQSQLDIYADWKNTEGLKVGADYRWGILNAGVTYNPSTSDWEYSAGLGAYFKDGGEQEEEIKDNIGFDEQYNIFYDKDIQRSYEQMQETKEEKTMSIDTDMYYELLAAGADIEII